MYTALVRSFLRGSTFPSRSTTRYQTSPIFQPRRAEEDSPPLHVSPAQRERKRRMCASATQPPRGGTRCSRLDPVPGVPPVYLPPSFQPLLRLARGPVSSAGRSRNNRFICIGFRERYRWFHVTTTNGVHDSGNAARQ